MNQTVEKKSPLPLWRRLLLFVIFAAIAGLVLVIVSNFLIGQPTRMVF